MNFAISAGALPGGLTLTGASLMGTPTQAGTFNFTVRATDSNDCSGTRAYTLTSSVVAPALTTLTPSNLIAGSGAFTLTVNGANFVNGAIIKWNGVARTTTFVSATQLTTAVAATEIRQSALINVTVLNPAPGGGESAAQIFTVIGQLGNASAASYSTTEFAANSITAVFGVGLATTTTAARTVPLPTALSGTSVKVRDSANVERLAPLFFVSPGQVSYLVPDGTAAGNAIVTITSGDGLVSSGAINVSRLAPGLFAANANGKGVAAALGLRVRDSGQQGYESLASYDATQRQYLSTPIDLGPPSERVFLVLFGTGIRGNTGLTAVSANLGGLTLPVTYAGAQGLVGLDQINLLLPRSLIGRGEINLTLTVDGRVTNTVKVNIR